jgi:hypothetical protein
MRGRIAEPIVAPIKPTTPQKMRTMPIPIAFASLARGRIDGRMFGISAGDTDRASLNQPVK